MSKRVEYLLAIIAGLLIIWYFAATEQYGAIPALSFFLVMFANDSWDKAWSKRE